jgi:putative ABC transport system substrate-binding protein
MRTLRRNFRILIALAVAATVIGQGNLAIAQNSAAPKRIGALSGFGCGGEAADVMNKRMAELGWIEGQGYVVDCVSTLDLNQLSTLARDLVTRRPDVLVSSPIQYIRALKGATTTIPIIMIATTDPVESGLVTNLPRPEANVTGVALSTPELVTKRIELVKELFPHGAHLAIINPTVAGGSYPKRLEEIVTVAAARLGVTWQAINAVVPEDVVTIFARLEAEGFHAAYLPPNPLFYRNQSQIAQLAQKHRIATLSDVPQFARSGFLLTYGVDLPALWKRSVDYIDKVLRGAKPGELPVEQPARFNLTINLKTAKALGITIPDSILARADELIE